MTFARIGGQIARRDWVAACAANLKSAAVAPGVDRLRAAPELEFDLDR